MKNVPETPPAKVVTLGRNFLNVASFKEFLKQNRQLFSEQEYNMFKGCSDRCLTGTPTIEVTVEAIFDNGLAQCHFFSRGVNMEVLHAPAACLRAIKPVPERVHSVQQNHERDYLARATA